MSKAISVILIRDFKDVLIIHSQSSGFPFFDYHFIYDN